MVVLQPAIYVGLVLLTGRKVIPSQESHNVKIWHTVILHTVSGTIHNRHIKTNLDVGVLVDPEAGARPSLPPSTAITETGRRCDM